MTTIFFDLMLWILELHFQHKKGSKNHVHSQAFMTQIPFNMMIIAWALRSFAKQK